MSTINDQAAKRRLQIEEILNREYVGKTVSISGETYRTTNPNNWGLLKSIGVDWIGGDDYQVILNLDDQRIVMNYTDFVQEVGVIDGL